MKEGSWAGEVAQWIGVLAAKPDDLRLIPKTHMVEGEKQLLQDFL